MYCKKCSYHWSQVWVKPKGRHRSQSKRKKEAAKKQAAEHKQVPAAADIKEKKEQEELQDLTVLAKKAPWMQTTPHSRLQQAVPPVQDGDLPLPPQPLLPKPPDAKDQKLTEQELQLLKHLQGIRSYGMDMTDSMKEQLENLETRQKVAAPSQVLNHGHINRHKKLKEKVRAAAEKIRGMDADWNNFVKDTLAKVQAHASLYQTCRGDLMTLYNQKIQELQQIQHEMKSASESLMAPPGEEVHVEAMPDMTGQLEALRSVLREETSVEVTISDDEMEAPLHPEDPNEEELLADQPAAKPTIFRHAQSPTKVANLHLKAKPTR